MSRTRTLRAAAVTAVITTLAIVASASANQPCCALSAVTVDGNSRSGTATVFWVDDRNNKRCRYALAANWNLDVITPNVNATTQPTDTSVSSLAANCDGTWLEATVKTNAGLVRPATSTGQIASGIALLPIDPNRRQNVTAAGRVSLANPASAPGPQWGGTWKLRVPLSGNGPRLSVGWVVAIYCPTSAKTDADCRERQRVRVPVR